METPTLTRRAFVGGLVALIAAPAIVRASSLMPIKTLEPDFIWLSHDDMMDYHPGTIEQIASIVTGRRPWVVSDQQVPGLGHMCFQDIHFFHNSKRLRGLLRRDGIETIDANNVRYYLARERAPRPDRLNDNAMAPTSWT